MTLRNRLLTRAAESHQGADIEVPTLVPASPEQEAGLGETSCLDLVSRGLPLVLAGAA